jgi:outer membrane biosynthesis protein TonB
MDSYTITIAPNDDSGNSTTLVVDTSGDQIRITDVHLHAAGGLSGGTMPTVDFRLLLRAVGTSASGQPRIEPAPADVPAHVETAAPADTTEPVSERIEEPRPAKATRSPRAERTAAATPVAEPKRPRPRRRRAANTTAPEETATGTRRRRTPAKIAAAKKAAVKKATAPNTSGGRAYRRMPEDFRAVYQQTSSPAAIADHYGVPRHTAQGWIRRIKNDNN